MPLIEWILGNKSGERKYQYSLIDPAEYGINIERDRPIAASAESRVYYGIDPNSQKPIVLKDYYRDEVNPITVMTVTKYQKLIQRIQIKLAGYTGCLRPETGDPLEITWSAIPIHRVGILTTNKQTGAVSDHIPGSRLFDVMHNRPLYLSPEHANQMWQIPTYEIYGALYKVSQMLNRELDTDVIYLDENNVKPIPSDRDNAWTFTITDPCGKVAKLNH